MAAHCAEELGAAVDLIEFAELGIPVYDGDLEAGSGIPPGALRLADSLRQAGGWILSSPEYNYSIPGPLKNAIDWVSRVKPQPFKGLPVLLLAASPSAIGGERCLAQLRLPLAGLGCFVYPQHFSLPHAGRALGSDGQLSDPQAAQRLQTLIEGFLAFAGAVRQL